jgi:hypothetical protein
MADSSDLRSVADELYGLSPEEFTAARTAAERRARSSGDRELAAAVKALRRPTLSAWAVNRLVRERSELVTQVVGLGESLRQAQSLLQGDALRQLTRQRRQLVAAVVAEARALAAGHGQKLSEAAARQVEETLQAAMADPDAADAVLSGLLTQPLSSTGVESLAQVLAVPDVKAEQRPQLTVVRDDGRERRDAEERVQAAGRAVRAAAKAFDSVTKKRKKAEARVLQVEAEIEELRRQLAELETASEEAGERLEELDEEVEEARAALDEARHGADAAAQALDRL